MLEKIIFDSKSFKSIEDKMITNVIIISISNTKRFDDMITSEEKIQLNKTNKRNVENAIKNQGSLKTQ